MAKHGFDYATGAAACALRPGRFADNVDRARRVLLECLRKRWWGTRERPVPLAQTRFPHAGLLVDTQTIEVNKPKARFEEAKAYWDRKNKIYGLKKEVAVRAAAPHYCMFTQKGRVASVHDYTIIKETFETYLEYLRKTDDERNALPADRASRFWAAVLDKAYVGPAGDTPNFRRITPVRNAVAVTDAQPNAAVNPIRVPVEQFFGRMWKAWGVLRHPYRFDHATSTMTMTSSVCSRTNSSLRRHSTMTTTASTHSSSRCGPRRVWLVRRSGAPLSRPTAPISTPVLCLGRSMPNYTTKSVSLLQLRSQLTG